MLNMALEEIRRGVHGRVVLEPDVFIVGPNLRNRAKAPRIVDVGSRMSLGVVKEGIEFWEEWGVWPLQSMDSAGGQMERLAADMSVIVDNWRFVGSDTGAGDEAHKSKKDEGEESQAKVHGRNGWRW